MSRRQTIKYAIEEVPSLIHFFEQKVEDPEERQYAVDGLVKLEDIIVSAIEQNKKSKQSGSKFKAKQLDAIYEYYSEVCTKIAENKARGNYG